MIYRIGMENGDEDRSVAWVLGHPGCFAYGKDPQEALEAVPGAVRDYIDWIEKNHGSAWISWDDSAEGVLEENYDVFWVNEQYEPDPQGYSVNAWFRHDWKPLTAQDVERGLLLLDWSRRDLQETIAELDPETMQWKPEGERWSLEGIVKHIGSAEWWYQDRLGLTFPRREVPEDAIGRLKFVRESLVKVLPTLVGVDLVRGKDAEFWSPRKMLRRAVWHERDHTQHIRKLLQRRAKEALASEARL